MSSIGGGKAVFGQTPGGLAGATHTQSIDEISFTLPVGLQITKVAGDPLVHWPVVADWDQRGRLVVVESGGVERPIQEHNRLAVHRIVRLSDTDGDGRFDSRQVAAEDLPFTEGVLCLGNTLLAAAPPQILKLTDEDGDGVCEKREVWFDGQTITGCANDLHGPYLGHDGWVYWCKGAFAEQTHRLLNGKLLKDRAAHIYRRPIEGGPIDCLISGGMDNPVEVAFTPEGEKFFTSTFLQHPGNGRRDGLGHAVYGSVFGKDHSAIEGLIRTGPLMPIMTHLGPAAPSGLTCLRRDQLTTPAPPKFQRTLVSAQFNLQKVAAHRLIASGSTYRTEDFDLVVADRVDFHPTDVLEDAAGGLLILDTGGWYDLCCPTSRVDQRVAGGGIYRLSRTDGMTGKTAHDARSQIRWQDVSLVDCVEYLHDARPWIRRSALLHLVEFGDEAVLPLSDLANAEAEDLDRRLTALGALSRIGSTQALEAVRLHVRRQLDAADQSPALLSPEAAALCRAAAQILAMHRHAGASEEMRVLAKCSEPAVARVAAEALGRIGSLPEASSEAEQSLAVLMEVAAKDMLDRTLEHSLLYALIELENAPALARYLESSQPVQRRLAMEGLAQLESWEHLKAEQLFQAVAGEDPAVRKSALDLLAGRREYAGESEQDLQRLWTDSEEQNDESVFRLLRAWRTESSIEAISLRWLKRMRLPADARRAVRLLGCWNNEVPPASWNPLLTEWLSAYPAEVVPGLTLLDLRGDSCQPIVNGLLSSLQDCRDLELARQLIAALPGRHDISNDWVLKQLFEQGEFQLLSRVRLNRGLATQLATQLPQLNANQLPLAIESLSAVGDEQLDALVLEILPELPAARTLPAETLENCYREKQPHLRQLAGEVSRLLVEPPADQQAEVAKLLADLEGGNPVRGLEVFRGAKANCGACHQMGYLGGSVGPELTRIGRTRTRTALLESILFPNARIEQSFQSTKILTSDGQVFNGLIRSEDATLIMLQVAADRVLSIRKDDIERRELSEVSIMPGGLRELLSTQELADLLALLESAK